MPKLCRLVFLFVLAIPVNSPALTGLKPGSKAPELVVKNVEGEKLNLAAKNETLVLAFYRGSWCPYCMRQLKSLQKEVYPKLSKLGARLVAISVDRPMVAKKMKERFELDFYVVSDPEAKTLKHFKIANKLSDDLVKKYKSAYQIDVEADSGQTHHIVAHPGVFIVKDGEIVFADVHTDYKERTENPIILKTLEELKN